jgi:hypothetical protein
LRVRIFQASTVQAEKVCMARLLAWLLAAPTCGCITISYLDGADIARKMVPLLYEMRTIRRLSLLGKLGQ